MLETLAPSGSPWAAYAAVAVAAYLALVRSLRYQRERAMRRKYKYPDRESMAHMTNDDAQAIVQYMTEYEFPHLYRLSVEFALFKTYTFKSISGLLLATRELYSDATKGKRAEDTSLLIGEFSSNAPTSERALKAIARMNFLHSTYIAKGLIKNEDMLYTLFVALGEPVRFMRLYEWRSMNEMEVCAVATFWKSIGDAMGIDYSPLQRHGKWRDGIEFYEDLEQWSKEYAIAHMVPAPSNNSLAEATIQLLLWYVPRFLMPVVREVLYTMMGDRMRDAFLYPEPSVVGAITTFVVLQSRKLMLRHLFLPRITPSKYSSDREDPKTGRLYRNLYFRDPYYHKPTFWARWGPTALVTRLIGGRVPDANAKKFQPEGYFTEEVGPRHKVGKGLDEVRSNVEKLRKERPAGCPFF